MTHSIPEYWQAYLESLPRYHPYQALGVPQAWGFGNTPGMADELGQLVLDGLKTATCSMLWEVESDGELLPQAGDLSIILDGAGYPICLVETVQVEVKPFAEVESRFAYAEGEGDRSLEYWREVHRRYFTPICARLGRGFDENTPLVCERFRVIYKGDGEPG